MNTYQKSYYRLAIRTWYTLADELNYSITLNISNQLCTDVI